MVGAERGSASEPYLRRGGGRVGLGKPRLELGLGSRRVQLLLLELRLQLLDGRHGRRGLCVWRWPLWLQLQRGGDSELLYEWTATV